MSDNWQIPEGFFGRYLYPDGKTPVLEKGYARLGADPKSRRIGPCFLM